MNNESYDFEDRKYVDPTLSRDEQLAFVDNLRSVQQSDMAKIARDTHNLGTDLPSSEGGLSGSEGIWGAQYVDPKVNEMVTGLRSAAQAQALNNILSNFQEQWTKRYNDAYRAAEKRKEKKDYGDDDDDEDDDYSDKPEYVASDSEGKEVAKKEKTGSGENLSADEQAKAASDWAKLYTNTHYPGMYGGY